MNVKFTPRAESEAEAKTRWWRSNRLDSPDLFDQELAEAIAAIRRESIEQMERGELIDGEEALAQLRAHR